MTADDEWKAKIEHELKELQMSVVQCRSEVDANIQATTESHSGLIMQMSEDIAKTREIVESYQRAKSFMIVLAGISETIKILAPIGAALGALYYFIWHKGP